MRWFTSALLVSAVVAVGLCWPLGTVLAGDDLASAKQLYDDGWWNDAQAMLEKIVDNGSADAAVYHQLAVVYVSQLAEGWPVDWKRMEGCAKKSIELDGSKAEYYITLGDAKGLQAQEGSKLKAPGRAKGAKKALERAREIAPTNIDAMQWLIEYYLQAPGIAGGSKDKAKATADEIIELDEARGYTSWARIHEYLGDLDQARIAAQKAIDADPDNRARRYQYARICYEQKNYDDAEAVFLAVVEENPDDPEAYVSLGDGYRTLERWDDAEAAYRKAIELEPDNIDARKKLGYLFQNEAVKRWEDAFAEFEKILELDSTRADALYQIGKTCVLSESQLDRGETCFKDYLNARVKGWWPQPADAHWRLAMIYDLRGDTDLAMAELKTAREINPKHKASKSMQSELKKQKRRGKR